MHEMASAEGVLDIALDYAKQNDAKCIREIGCPGIVVEDGKIMVDASQCTGCGICADICPFAAIAVTSFDKREGGAK